jgi:uncharacterized membrane protein YbhN (UPF0104 family)
VSQPAAEAQTGRRRRAAWVIRVVGIAIAVLAVVLLARTLAGQWSEVRSSIVHASFGWLAVGLASSAVSMTGLGVLWWRCFHIFGAYPRLRDAVSWYFGGELGKYLPGGVWQVLGRGEMAQRGNVRRSTAYATTLISYGAMCVAAAIACGVLAPIASADGDGLGWGWLLLLLIPVGVAAVHPAFFGRILAFARKATKGRLALDPPPWNQMLGLIAWAIPTWLFLGGASVAVTAALGYDQHPARIAFAAIAAWILGFLAVPVPAGAGLRELVFVGLCGLESAPATAVAAIARLLLIVVDGLGGLLGLWFARQHTPAPLASSDT